jgi:hypothetical protein
VLRAIIAFHLRHVAKFIPAAAPNDGSAVNDSECTVLSARVAG